MDFDIDKIYTNFILRLVIFSVFMYKRYFDDVVEYQSMVKLFVEKRIPRGMEIDVSISNGPNISEKERRNEVLNSILYDRESPYLIEVSLILNKKIQKNILIDLSDQEKYETFLAG